MKIFLSQRSLKILKISFILIFSLTLISAAALASSTPLALAAEESPAPLNFKPQLTIPNSDFNGEQVAVGSYNSETGIMTSDLLAKYIKAFYNYGVGVAGILAAIVLMAGGVLWLTSAGNDSKVAQAKELIAGSITGILILFCSWIILNTINPELVKLRPIQTQVIKKVNIICCEFTDSQGQAKAEMLDKVVCLTRPKAVVKESFYSMGGYEAYALDVAAQKCVEPGCCVRKNNDNGIWMCYDTISSQCPSTASDEFINTRCDKTKYADSCPANLCALAETEDGDSCWKGGFGWCYNKICWMAKGAEGEPCGNRGGSLCTKPNNNERCGKNAAGQELFRDQSGGRGCGPDLWCCNTID